MYSKIKFKLLNAYKRAFFPGSVNYWEKRYQDNGSSGEGSAGVLAEFKAETINKLVLQNEIKSVIEWGCGDGNQLKLATYPKYIGLDVSRKAIELCQSQFNNDASKSFFIYDPKTFTDKTGIFKAELAMSLDVIFHIIEDKLFFLYMNHLFNSANKYVIIYASNFDEVGFAHVKHRNFTEYIKKNIGTWELERVIKNKYPSLTVSDLYVFRKQESTF